MMGWGQCPTGCRCAVCVQGLTCRTAIASLGDARTRHTLPLNCPSCTTPIRVAGSRQGRTAGLSIFPGRGPGIAAKIFGAPWRLARVAVLAPFALRAAGGQEPA